MSNDAEKINRAIRACIRACCGSNAILAQIAKYLDDLRQDSDWHESEIRLVESGVRRLLKGMLAEKKSTATRDVPKRKSA